MNATFPLRTALLAVAGLCSGCLATQDAIDGSQPLHPQRVDLVVSADGRSELAFRFFPRAWVYGPRSNEGLAGMAPRLPARRSREGTVELLPRFPGCSAVRVFAAAGRKLEGVGVVARHLDRALQSPERHWSRLGTCTALAFLEVPRPGTTDLVLASSSGEIWRIRVDDATGPDPGLLVILPPALLFDAVTGPVQVAGVVCFFVTFGS